MNEASSKFVDQLAVDKLISEKLQKVNHFPDESFISNISLSIIEDIAADEIKFNHELYQERESIYFPSYIPSGDSKNDVARILFYESNQNKKIGNLVFVHGLYEDNLDLYNYFITQLNNIGIDVYLFFLPFHYSRKPDHSLYSGEFFWSGNIHRSISAFKQTLFDLSILYNWIKSKNGLATVLSGFSMGGGISLTLASLIKLDKVFAINPVSNITSLVWNSKLFSPVKKDFESAGLDFDDVKNYFNEFDPMDRDLLATPIENVTIGFSLFDQINNPENYQLLIDKWSMTNYHKYKAGHLNVFRVPKLPLDIKKQFDLY